MLLCHWLCYSPPRAGQDGIVQHRTVPGRMRRVRSGVAAELVGSLRQVAC